MADIGQFADALQCLHPEARRRSRGAPADSDLPESSTEEGLGLSSFFDRVDPVGVKGEIILDRRD
ncbi:MAG: hypothetical protein WA709_10395, partial [Stellaceae bacterium]